jgi:3-oxoacyl-[acyl-carrier protein] reductase
VIANHRAPSETLEDYHNQYPGQLHLVPGDIGEETTAVAIADTARSVGNLHTLIHNAGISRDQPLTQMSVENWDDVQRVNLRGAFLATKHALRIMIRRRYGRIVYLSSISAIMGNAGQANYAASKAGLHGLARTVAQEYASFNVRTTVLAIGVLDVGLGAAMTPQNQRRKTDRSLLGLIDGKQVAETLAYLSGPNADYINSEVIRMDGGMRY